MTHEQIREVDEHGIAPCPFCGQPLTYSSGRFNKAGRCDTVGCWLNERKMTVPVDALDQVAQFNTRPPADICGGEVVDPELIARVEFIMNAPGKERWKVANLTNYDWRRILAALSSRSATPEVGGEELVERVAFSMWKAEAMRAAPNVGKHRTIQQFREELPWTKEKWLGLSRAAIAAMPTPDATRAETTAQVVAWLNNRALEQISDDSGVPNDDHAAARYNALHFAALDLARGFHLTGGGE